MKKIYINGRFLTQNITGVQRYAIEIVKALDKYLSDNNLNNKYKFEIVCPSPSIAPKNPLSTFLSVPIGVHSFPARSISAINL